MFRCCLVSTVVIVFTASDIRADELLYRYEANVHPYDPAAGWITADSCVPPCSDNVDDGRFNLVWATSGDPVNYHYTIAGFGDPVPPNLWVEWRFRSNNPLPPTDDACDGRFRVKFRTILEVVYMFSDAAVSFSGDIVTRWTDVQEFQTFRFESLDGVGYRITVNGRPFITDVGLNIFSSADSVAARP
jgi:hypothetical protein